VPEFEHRERSHPERRNTGTTNARLRDSTSKWPLAYIPHACDVFRISRLDGVQITTDKMAAGTGNSEKRQPLRKSKITWQSIIVEDEWVG
jgi:hypothetical protein